MWEHFGKLLKENREENGYSLEQLRQVLEKNGFEIRNKSTISKWENGKHRPSSEKVEALEDILGFKRGTLLRAARYFIELPDDEPSIKDKSPQPIEEQRLGWIEAHKAKTGKYPILPEPLVKLVPNYTLGEPINKELKPKMPSWGTIQTMGKIEGLYMKWREFLEWLGHDPDEWEYRAVAQAPPGGGNSTYLTPKRKLIPPYR